MRILVTGAAGFIGSNLIEGLLSGGHEVVGFDNLSQGTLLNLEAVTAHPRFHFRREDVRDMDSLIDATRGCEVIFHLAAYKIPRYGNAYETLEINSKGTVNAIEAAVRNKARLIFSSTSDVYGRNPDVPFKEDHDLVLGPPDVRRWAYAISKAFDEQLIFAEGERRQLSFTIVRFFGGYGPNQALDWWGGPQSVFINQALDGLPMTVHGDGAQTRSFTYVDDHVDGLIRCLERKEALGQVFNLGSTEEISIADLARLIWRVIRPGSPAPLQFVPYSTFGKYTDVLRRVPDLSKSRAFLGFEPRWALEKGLTPTIEWQRARRERLAADAPYGISAPRKQVA